MKKLFTEHFNAIWRAIFIILFIGIMLPLRCFMNYEYDPGWFAVPNYIWGWLIYGIIVYVLIVIYSRMALKRDENHVYDEKKGE